VIGLWLFPPLAGRVGTSPSYAGLASWVREHCLGRRSVPATHSPGCLRLLQLPVHNGGVDLATRVRHQTRQGGTNGRFVVAHGGLLVDGNQLCEIGPHHQCMPVTHLAHKGEQRSSVPR
jgi:hypothetical protein